MSGENMMGMENVVGDVLQNKEVRRFWEEKISGIALYHGTSETNAKVIAENGFDPDEKPYSFEDKKFIEDQLKLRGVEVNPYNKGKENIFFVQESTKETINYALMGPEIVRLSFYPEIRSLISKMDTERQSGVSVEESLYGRAVEIKQKLLESMYNHRPALIKINEDSSSFKRILKERLKGLGDVVHNYDTFLSNYESFIRDGMNPDMALRFLVKLVEGNLENVPLGFKIDSGEVRLIAGDSFDNLSVKTRGFAEVRKFVFGNEKRQPPELLNSLVAVASGFDNNYFNMKMILGMCAYYEIDSETGEGLYNKAVEFRDRSKV